MLNSISAGFDMINYLVNDFSINKPLIVNRVGCGVFIRGQDFGIDTVVLCKLARIAGADCVYTGVISGSLAESEQELRRDNVALKSELYHIKPCFSVVSGGIKPRDANFFINIEHQGPDVMVQAGTGLFNFPYGIRAAAYVMRRMSELWHSGNKFTEAINIIDKELSAIKSNLEGL